MPQRRVANLSVIVALVAVSLAGVKLAGQTAASSTPNAQKANTAPRGPDWHQDLSGVWAHNAATPLQRPTELAGRAELTDDEVRAMTQKAQELFGGDGDAAFGDSIYTAVLQNILGKEKGFTSRDAATGDYNSFWIVDRWFEKRTSLLTDPSDGRLPAQTEAARQRQAANAAARRGHQFDGPEDIALGERCSTGSVPMMGAGYNNYYQIVQNPTYVGVNMEMRHDTRNIPITTREHLPKSVRLWLGDSIGRWEGDTFVVDTTNFRDDSPVGNGGATPTTHIVERFSRVAANQLKYEVTVDDPATWTRPWTAVEYMRLSKDQIYEYACHEGNKAMSGTLHGERVKEQQERAKAGTTSSPQ